jgi:WD40 repeat protein
MRDLMTHLLLVMLFTTGLSLSGLFLPQTAVAQRPVVLLIGYGQTIPGEVSDATGSKQYFTGCVGEVLDISVTANDFSPQVELYYADEVQPVASATAQNSVESKTVILRGVTLPTSGRYTILVSGRNPTDLGGYSLTMHGVAADGDTLDDDPTALDLTVDQRVTGTLRAGRSVEWNFRGCEGDTIEAQLVGKSFIPKVTLYDSRKSASLVTSVASISGSEGFSVSLRYTLPATSRYRLVAAGASRSEFGNYNLGLFLKSIGEPTPQLTKAPTKESTEAPTANAATSTPNPTHTSGTQVQSGGTSTQVAPSPTPPAGFLMPRMGESAFRVLNISAQKGPANNIAYAPDGDSFASAGEDGRVHLWNTFDGRSLRSMAGHTARATSVAFAPDGTLLASAGGDGSVRLWNPTTGESVAELIMPSESVASKQVTSVAFSPDGTQLVATSEAGDVILWDVAKRRILQELRGQTGAVYHAAFSPDGLSIAAGDANGTVHIWAVAGGKILHTLPVNRGPGGGDPILSVAFSRDGQRLVVGGVIGINAASVHIWEIESEEEIGRLEGHEEWGSSAVFSPNDAYILSTGRDEPGYDGPTSTTTRLWDANTGDVRVGFFGYPNSVIAATFRPDGEELLTSDGYTVYIWPAPLAQVFAAAFGEPVGVQIPGSSAVTIAIAMPTGIPTDIPTANPTVTPTASPTARLTATPVSNAIATADTSPTTIPTAIPTAIPTVAPTATLTPTPIATPTLAFVALDIFCTVTAERLNLRPGPGTTFNPPLTTLDAGASLILVGRNADASWLQVTELDVDLDSGFTGWVSTDFVSCTGEINYLPVVE